MYYRDTDGTLKKVSAINGLSAFESAQIGGFKGTETDFYDKLGNVVDKTDLDALKDSINLRLTFYTPQMFGAKGDGKADDTKAIQKMFDSIPNGSVVHFPTGVYNISDTITLEKFVNIEGENNLLMWKSLSSNMARSNSQINYIGNNENVTLFEQTKAYTISIKNMMFYGNAFEVTGNTADFTNAPYSYYTDNIKKTGINGIKLMDGGQIYVDTCAFVGFSGYAIMLNGDHRYLRNCCFFNCNVGVEITGTDCLIEHDWFCLCHVCIKCVDKKYKFALLKVADVWADQISGNVIRSENADRFVLMANNLWIDMVDGAGIYSEAIMEKSRIDGRISRCGMTMGGATYSTLTNEQKPFASAIYAKRIVNCSIDITIDRRIIGKGSNANGICPVMAITTKDNLFTNSKVEIDCNREFVYQNGGLTNVQIKANDVDILSNGIWDYVKTGITFRTLTPVGKVIPMSANQLAIDTTTKHVYLSTGTTSNDWIDLTQDIIDNAKI